MNVSSVFRPLGLAVALTTSIPVMAVTPASVSSDVIQRGWKPSVEFSGAGDSKHAVGKMREMAALQEVVFKNTEYHKETQEFIDELWSSLESFNLKKLYRMLPDENGAWRQLTVVGALDGELYHLGPVQPRADKNELAEGNVEKVNTVNRTGEIQALGDLVSNIRVKELSSDAGTSYLIQNNLQLGIGAFSWDAVLGSGEEVLRLAVEGDSRFGRTTKMPWAQDYRMKVQAMNLTLDEQDVEILAPLWAAFPESWNLLTKLGRVDDVVIEDDASGGYQHLVASFSLIPDLMDVNYPELASHLDGLNSLLKGVVEIEDGNGRLLRLTLDSRTLSGTIDAYVTQGRLLPVKNGKVVTNVAPVRLGDGREFSARVDSTMSILGVVTRMKGIETTIRYQPTEKGAVIQTSMTQVPEIYVEGAALGFMPTAIIDLFLPTNIDELMREFMTVAVKGNDGKGIVTRTEFSQLSVGELAKVNIAVSFEALNNFMVRIGMGIVSDRIIPDSDVSKDIQQLIYDTEEAFSKDLDGFEKVAVL
ncbi:hypothetical protein A9Q81_27320 [Gammaproteobacteria bacterium 42_54_T18]|nr:hypothetical protein A9Q81_27320 [Gammaproteobacteria bacterium 42_54_T18]